MLNTSEGACSCQHGRSSCHKPGQCFVNLLQRCKTPAYCPLTFHVRHASNATQAELECGFENLVGVRAALCILQQEDASLQAVQAASE